MTLRIADKWVWDFWFARDGADIHIFYLQADRALKEESLRHWHVSIGHAVSQNLSEWTILPDALRPSPMPEDEGAEPFDSYTTWTGSIIRQNGLWYLFYTGGKRSEQGLVQRVGLATSSDLTAWTKHPDNPLIVADPQRYELLDLSAWHDQTWRDPFIFRDPQTRQFHAYITARIKDGEADARGVIGHARSDDLIHWEILPPLTEPGEFGHMEVPQMVEMGGRYYLLFCVGRGQYSAARKSRAGIQLQTGTHYLVADSPFGPYRYLTDDFLSGDAHGSLYSGKLIQDNNGRWQFMAFHHFSPDGMFLGEISDPIPVHIEDDGRLRLVQE